MKSIEKIIIAGIVGTTFMTLYSCRRAKKEQEQYIEPVLINKLIDNSKNLPEIQKEKCNPIGWALHYTIGFFFVLAYWILWRKALHKPTIINVLIIGSLSGIAGMVAWKLFFSKHDNPPYNYRPGYYRQLFFAHIIFSVFALTSYSGLNYIDDK